MENHIVYFQYVATDIFLLIQISVNHVNIEHTKMS